MRIVHVCISERYVEGDSYHENILPTKHKRMGHSVTVIASQDYYDGRTKSMKHRDVSNYFNKDGIHVIILPSYKGNKVFRLLKRTVCGLYEAIANSSPDVIFVHGVKSPDNFAIAHYAKSHSEVKVFADNHNDGNVTPSQKGLLPWLYRWVEIRNARGLLSVVQCYWGTLPLRAEYLNTYYKIPKAKISVLIMGGDDDIISSIDPVTTRSIIRERYGIPKDAFLVVTGGAFDRRKQQQLLMEAVKEIKNERVWLLAFGEPVKGMEVVFEPYRSVHNIIMTGWLPSESAYELFIASDLAFFPGWHSVLWEQAVACGIPIVVKKWQGVDHINSNGNAVLMDTVDVESIKAVIEKLCYTPCYDRLLKSARIAAPHFYMSHIANKAIGLE